MTVEWVLVTGASRGIGHAVAERLMAKGYGVVLWARTIEDLAAADEVRSHVRVASVDVSDSRSVARAGQASLRGISSLRAVVINAGSGTWSAFSELSVADWRATVATNLDGAFYTLRSTVSRLTANRVSQVIGIASDSALYPFAGRAAYCASKSGMKALLDSVRLETRGAGMRTTLILPSRVDTFFGGKRPGDRPGALPADDIANIVCMVLDIPAHIEIRELHISAMTSGFGPFEERMQ